MTKKYLTSLDRTVMTTSGPYSFGAAINYAEEILRNNDRYTRRVSEQILNSYRWDSMPRTNPNPPYMMEERNSGIEPQAFLPYQRIFQEYAQDNSRHSAHYDSIRLALQEGVNKCHGSNPTFNKETTIANLAQNIQDMLEFTAQETGSIESAEIGLFGESKEKQVYLESGELVNISGENVVHNIPPEGSFKAAMREMRSIEDFAKLLKGIT